MTAQTQKPASRQGAAPTPDLELAPAPAFFSEPKAKSELISTLASPPAPAAGPGPPSKALQQPSLTPIAKPMMRNTPKTRIQTSDLGSPTRVDQLQDQLSAMIGGDLPAFQIYQKVLASMYPGLVPPQADDESPNTEPQALETGRRMANLPTYPADSQIPNAPRGAPAQYTNVLPRVDQIQKHVPQAFTPHYPQDLRNSLRRQKYPGPYITDTYQQRPNLQSVVDENQYSHLQSNRIPPFPIQFDPRFGSVRSGREVRSGQGIPKIRTGRGPQPPKVETEPEDDELELMNNIPYRLRAIPLTGPRFIR